MSLFVGINDKLLYIEIKTFSTNFFHVLPIGNFPFTNISNHFTNISQYITVNYNIYIGKLLLSYWSNITIRFLFTETLPRIFLLLEEEIFNGFNSFQMHDISLKDVVTISESFYYPF